MSSANDFHSKTESLSKSSDCPKYEQQTKNSDFAHRAENSRTDITGNPRTPRLDSSDN